MGNVIKFLFMIALTFETEHDKVNAYNLTKV